MKNFIILFCFLFSFSTWANYNLRAKMRQFHMSCGYYSKTVSDVELQFKVMNDDEEGNWALYYAWQAEGDSTLLWTTKNLEAFKNNIITTILSKDIISRGSPERFNKIHFYFKKVLKDEVVEQFPSLAPTNHFIVNTQAGYSTTCLRSVDELPTFSDAQIMELE